MDDAVASKPEDKRGHTRKDFKSAQEIRWCPGCGDYSILAQFQRVLADLDTPKERHVVVSGIGCASRFPYYMNTYGIHGIHGRAPTIATGIKLMRPELTVWVATGDGDALSIGGNHLIHALRRNVDIKILLFNNRIYGLTKGQYSPTSEVGKQTKSTPGGSLDYPVEPLRLALAAGATFVARTVDTDSKHLQTVLTRAARHRGAAFVEILQNCPIFNDGAFDSLKDKQRRQDNVLFLSPGEPLVYGADGAHGIATDAQLRPRIADSASADVLVHDEANDRLHDLVASLAPPAFPTPLGVLRALEVPTYDGMLAERVSRRDSEHDRMARLQRLLESGPTWTVEG